MEKSKGSLNYEKAPTKSSRRIALNEAEARHFDKELNISELNFNDEQSESRSINIDEAIQQFTYHHIPKKS